MEANDVIKRLCKLQEEVANHLNGEKELSNKAGSYDCFCGHGGFWEREDYDGTTEGGYRNDGLALDFIEEAVREKIKNDDG